MNLDSKQIALAYIDACGRQDLETIRKLLAPGVHFVGPGNEVTGAPAYLAVLESIGPVWERSDVQHVFVDGAHVCVVYDFVTNTPAGRVPIVEWLEIEAGQVARVRLFFDRVTFKPAADELSRRRAR